MNKINKYVPYLLRRTRWLSFNIERYQCKEQKREHSTRKQPQFIYFPSSNFVYKLFLSSSLNMFNFYIIDYETRHISNTNKTGLSNLVDSNDILLTNIKNVKQTSDLLHIVRLHFPRLTIEHNLQVLNMLFLLQKSKR